MAQPILQRGRWTEEEDARGRHLFAIGIRTRDIATALGRTYEATKQRLVTNKWRRKPSRFGEGVALLCQPGETFREVEATPGYWVSDLGRVVTMREERPGIVMRPEIDKDGYQRVNLVTAEGLSHRLVSRLVLEAFIGPRPEGMNGAHNNGKRDDNRAENLRWATQKENIADKYLHGTRQIGERSGMAKATASQIVTFKGARSQGLTLQEAAEFAGITYHIAASVSSGKTWRHIK